MPLSEHPKSSYRLKYWTDRTVGFGKSKFRVISETFYGRDPKDRL